jgi:hypothetical protein
MPIFKTTKDILKNPWEDELFNPNWMDSDKLQLPPKREWDYKRELYLEDVNIWEVLFHQGGGIGVYAAWDPYAEFYLITLPYFIIKENSIETYYGVGAQNRVRRRAKEFGINLSSNEIWVEPEDMWLYQDPEPKSNTLILP